MPARMKSFMILASVIGFLIGAGFSLAEGCPWSTALSRACFAALLAALLGRWWCGMWIQGLKEAIDQRNQPISSPPVSPKTPAKL